MTCTSPIRGWKKLEGGGMTTSLNKGYADQPMTVPCGQCITCRLERTRTWAIRCMHEAALHEQNIFTTITYDEEHLPYGETLVRSDLQKFIKRLRKKVPNLRIFYCGEYGDTTDRPHYHALLFNYRPNDAEKMAERNGKDIFRSDKLDKTWGMGHINFGNVEFQSAAYVAGYVTKKITGPDQEEHYQWIDDATGQIIDRTPPFQGSSKNPAIGHDWLVRWMEDVYSKDQIIIEGKAMRPPRYYDKMCEKYRPDLWRQVKIKRRQDDPNKFIIAEKEISEKIRKVIQKKGDPNAYKGSDRHLIVKNKIAISRQLLRNEQ